MKIVQINKSIPNQSPEDNFGNKEFKRYIIPQENRDKKKFISKRATQLLFRLIEGEGRACYILGIEDDGTIRGLSEFERTQTISNLQKMVKLVHAKIVTIRIYNKGVTTVRIILPRYKDEDNFI